MDEIPVISDKGLRAFFERRENLLSLIDSCDKEISSLSMCNWERFNFEPEYKAEYMALTNQKKKLITKIIDQDLFIMSKVGISFTENIA